MGQPAVHALLSGQNQRGARLQTGRSNREAVFTNHRVLPTPNVVHGKPRGRGASAPTPLYETVESFYKRVLLLSVRLPVPKAHAHLEQPVAVESENVHQGHPVCDVRQAQQAPVYRASKSKQTGLCFRYYPVRRSLLGSAEIVKRVVHFKNVGC